MNLAKGTLVAAICATMAVSGCSVESVQQMPPQSVDDCRANWKVERGVARVAIPEGTSPGEAFMMRFLSGFARQTTSTGDANARYRGCLQRFGVTDTDGFETAARQSDPTAPYLPHLAPVRPAHCPPGRDVFYGGSGYCVGR